MSKFVKKYMDCLKSIPMLFLINVLARIEMLVETKEKLHQP
jgi:hypothetical protein